MTNVVQSTLLRKLFVFTCIKKQINSINPTRSYYTSNHFTKAKGYSIILAEAKHSNFVLSTRLLSTTTSDKSDDTERSSQEKEPLNENEEDNSSERRSSTYYQQNRRRAYEHKRTNYEQNNADKENKLNNNTNLAFQLNHYDRLNIEKDADQNTIKSAYYSLSKIYHPDIVGTDDINAAENFRLITEAYDILSDIKQRESYDKELNTKINGFDSSNYDWTKPANPNKDFITRFRSRDADSIFRFRQDARLELEKRQNPRKFQAGSFGNIDVKDYDDERLIKQRLSSLKRQMETLSKSKKSDESEFYRMHLYDSVNRRHQDLLQAQTIHSQSKSSGDISGEITSLLTIVALLVGLLIFVLNIFVDIDIADYLDRRVEGRLEEKKEDKNNQDVVDIG